MWPSQSTGDRHILLSGPPLPSQRAPSGFKSYPQRMRMAEIQPGAFTMTTYEISSAHSRTEQYITTRLLRLSVPKSCWKQSLKPLATIPGK